MSRTTAVPHKRKPDKRESTVRFGMSRKSRDSFDDDEFDTDKPFVEKHLSRKTSNPRPKAVVVAGQGQGNTKLGGWLKKPAALFAGHRDSPAKSKEDVSPTRERAGSMKSALSANSSGTNASAALRPLSPSPGQLTNAPPQRVSSPPKRQVSQHKVSVSPHFDDDDASSNGGNPGLLADLSTRSASDLPSRLDRQKSLDSGPLKDSLEALQKEVRGLQESFSSLRREHNELRGEVRTQQGMSGSLPVELALRRTGSDLARSETDLPKRRESQRPDRRCKTAKALPSAPGTQATAGAPSVPEAAVRQSDAAPVDDGILGSFWHACGCGAEPTSQSSGYKPLAVAQSERPTSVYISTSGHGRSGAARPSKESLSGVDDLSVGTHELPPVNSMEMGGSSSSACDAQSGSGIRAPSPHIREKPMDGRSASTTGVQHAQQDVGGSHTRLVGGGGPASLSLTSVGDTIPHFGRSEESVSNYTRAHVSDDAATLRLEHSVAFSPDSRSGLTTKSSWRSPIGGEPLVLPFPEADEDTAASPVPMHELSPLSGSFAEPSGSLGSHEDQPAGKFDFKV